MKKCAYNTCGAPALPGSEWCGAHAIVTLEEEVNDMRKRKDSAYKERDMVLALAVDALAGHGLLAVLGRHPDSDPAWENDWRNIVYIELPNGEQLSWHIHDSELHWFSRLEKRPDYVWDGHTTEEKYERLLRFVAGYPEPASSEELPF